MHENTTPCKNCGFVVFNKDPIEAAKEVCANCGMFVGEEPLPQPPQPPHPTQPPSPRILCRDGNCIGIIGTDGLCKECGMPLASGTSGHDDKDLAQASQFLGTDSREEPQNTAIIQPTAAPSITPSNKSADKPSHTQLAERSTRFGAVMLDNLIFMACLIPGIIQLFIANSDGGKKVGFSLMVVGFLGLLIVQIVLLVNYGETIGKRTFGIRIVRVSDERIPGFVKVVLLRQGVTGIIAVIPYVGQVFWLADALFIFRDDKRCLHDLIAETKVIKVGSI